MRKLLAIFFSLLLLTSCNNHKNVTSAEFLNASTKFGKSETVKHASFLGVRNEKAYIQIWQKLAMREAEQYRTISVPLSELPLEVQSKIKEGIEPWVVAKLEN
ncbi:hypothetical protein [Pseudoalteromonas sp. R3]|uniref:hypothetical protein n=1 Tax=Pseudoalteromonas sp. R3 TaxID=1709477 RepID=UPI0006B68002|nr:hypothetical protein [Pseudoalteromonas sp. R3]AZZ99126.1 hypothetical protein ELR70_19685 [Pseudoalteromonas sp. R3]